MRLRARKEQDKNARRRAILDAALAVWSATSYADFTMSAVAERAGVVKGTVYLYFATKEELLLDLLEELFGACLDEIDRRLQEPRGAWNAKRVAGVLSGPLGGREALTRLLTTAGGIFEHNIGDERARRFKEVLRSRLSRTGGLLARRLPWLGATGAARLLLQFYALVTGFGEMAYPAPVVRRVVQEPGFEVFRIDVVREISTAVLALLEGLETRRVPRKAAVRVGGGPRRSARKSRTHRR
jgi:AcrR family transcriptional regulator